MREAVADAMRYWEARRLTYNLLLALVVLGWLLLSWPHFRPAFTLQSLAFLLVLALGANTCYCAAYLVEAALQASGPAPAWRRWRGLLWIAGTVFAILFLNYWIADEIYPFVR